MLHSYFLALIYFCFEKVNRFSYCQNSNCIGNKIGSEIGSEGVKNCDIISGCEVHTYIWSTFEVNFLNEYKIENIDN